MINSYEIAKLGNEISLKLSEKNLKNDNKLIILIDDDNFKKLDEDFYYRQNPDGKSYIPSDDEISLIFNNLKFIIKNNGKV